MTQRAPGGGLFESGKRALDSLLDLVMLRLELFGTELESEKQRWLQALTEAALGLLLLALALLGAASFVVLLFWDEHRLIAVAALTLLFGGLGLWLLGRARRAMRPREGGPFALTLGELRLDRAGLRPPASSPVQTPPP
jgi:uncharacterized membrane protein YqjE